MAREETLAVTQSHKMALNLINEYALTGVWAASDRNEHGIIYRNGDEELFIQKRDDRQWLIIKRTKEKAETKGGQ